MHATQNKQKLYADKRSGLLGFEAMEHMILRLPQLQALEERSILKVDSEVHRVVSD